MDTYKLQLWVTGENISPENVSASDLADLIQATELLAIAQSQLFNPELLNDKFLLSLVEISKGSLVCGFSSRNMESVGVAIDSVANAINSGDFSRVATSAIEHIKKLRTFTKKNNCAAEFIMLNGTPRSLVKITPETKIIDPPEIVGETVLYGKLIRVGGKSDPTAMIEISDDLTLTCEVGFDLAKQLAHRLYTWVGLNGRAHWSVVDRRISSFRISGISEYEDRPISESFKWLRDTLGPYYSGVDDPVKYTRNLREGRE